MPITATDIVAYGSQTMPDDDTPTGIGGAIKLTTRVVFTDIVATDEIEIISTSASDTAVDVTVFGRNAAGELVSDSETLTGTSAATITGTAFERVLKMTLSTAAAGVVTVRDQDTDTAIGVFQIGETEIRRPFYDASADASGGSARDYYEKIFFKNNHGSLTLTAAQIIEQADPQGVVTFALESTLDDSDDNGTGNRQTHDRDGAGLTFDSSDKAVATGQLPFGEAQGVWLKLSLSAGLGAQNTSVTMRVSGNTV